MTSFWIEERPDFKSLRRLQLEADNLTAVLLRTLAIDPPTSQTAELARKLAARLQRHGTVGLSSFYGDVAELHRAIQEAELVLDVLRRSDAPIAEDIGQGTYRLLFRVLASHPEEVRSFCQRQIAHNNIPRYVEFVDEFSMTITGKIQKFVMREAVEARLGLKAAKTA